MKTARSVGHEIASAVGVCHRSPIDENDHTQSCDLATKAVAARDQEAHAAWFLLRRAIKYAREDRMTTPRSTRLQRLLDAAERLDPREDDE